MSRSGTRPAVRLVAAVLTAGALGTTLGGCSQIYLERRDGIARSAGDAIAANQAVQVIDPWPRHSGNTNLVFNGQRMQSAAERYRTNTVVQPVDPMAPQLSVPAAPASATSGNNGSASNGAPNATLVIGAPVAAAAASP